MDDLKEIWNGSLEKGLFQDHWMSRPFSTKDAEGTVQVSLRNKKCITLVCSKDIFVMGVLAGCTSTKTIASVSNPLFPTCIGMLSPCLCWPYFPFASSFLLGSARRGCQRETGERENFPPIPVNVRLTHSSEFTSSQWIHFWFLQPVQLSCKPSESPAQEAGTLFFCNLGTTLRGPSASSELLAWVTQQSPPECLSLCAQGPSSRLLSFHIPSSSSYSSNLGGNHYLHLLLWDIPVSPVSSWLPNTWLTTQYYTPSTRATGVYLLSTGPTYGQAGGEAGQGSFPRCVLWTQKTSLCDLLCDLILNQL